MKDLHKMGFLEYFPSHNPLKGSLVEMFIFSTSSEQVMNSPRVESGTGTKQVLHPSLNNTNYLNNKQYISGEEEKSNNKKKSQTTSNKNSQSASAAVVQNINENTTSKCDKFTPPSKDELNTFFEEEVKKHEIPGRFAPLEAEKFMNYYTAKGWKVGNKSPMKDWRASARNWVLNFLQFNKVTEKVSKTTAGHLHANENKRYDIPL
jgi:hypothetical protein